MDLQVVIGIVGIIVVTMAMIGGILTFRAWGERDAVNPLYTQRQQPSPCELPGRDEV